MDASKESELTSEKKETKDSNTEVSEKPDVSTPNTKYELIDNIYYYTDENSGKRFMYDDSGGKWVETSTTNTKTGENSVTVDDEGRQYYYSDNMYLCRDTGGNVFFMKESTGSWEPWYPSEKEGSKWYFYQGDDTFYRDTATDKVYKLNKDNNEWDLFEGKLKGGKKRKKDDEEEFDTDDEISDNDEDPTRPPGFESDPCISYDGSTYLKHDPSDGVTYEWDVLRRAWFPKLDEDFMATYQLSYGFHPDGTKNENPLKFDDEEEKAPDPIPEQDKLKKTEKKKASWFDVDDAHNTKVYVSNLPPETSEQEFVDLMHKCGLVLKDPDTQNYKIKMYKDKDGHFKGDALCTYIRIESVDLALQILDGCSVGGKTVTVERAKFTLKGDYDPSLKPKKKNKKQLEKLQKKQDKLLDWRPEPMRGQRAKHENTVVIRNAFSPQEFETEAEKLLTHKEALRAQCETFGAVKKLDLFDRHPEGILKVVFEEVEAADMCVATLNNRLYQNRRLKVETWDGKESFKIEETEEEKSKRLKNWEAYLEGKTSGAK